MKVSQRYRQLSTWNKIGFWGSICSIVGLVLYLLVPSGQSKTSIRIDRSPGAVVQSAVDSPNTTQIGSLTITQNGHQYRPISPELRRHVEQNLAAFREKYSGMVPVVRVEYESGNNERFKVGAILGEMLATQSLGSFASTSTSIGRFPGFPVTLHCGTNGSAMALDFLSAVSGYLTGQVNVVTLSQWPANQVRLYLNGTPSFAENGAVTIQ
jgi:hypothetical protein